MARTTPGLVQSILGNDYDTDNKPSLQPYIAIATLVIDAVVTCASSRGVSLSNLSCEMMERWMAAHYYTKSDRVPLEEKTQDSSAVYVLNPETPEPYKDAALDLDTSGCLRKILARKRASILWIGKDPSQQIPYRDRM